MSFFFLSMLHPVGENVTSFIGVILSTLYLSSVRDSNFFKFFLKNINSLTRDRVPENSSAFTINVREKRKLKLILCGRNSRMTIAVEAKSIDFSLFT